MKEDRAISLNAILEFLGDTNMDIFTDEVKEFVLQLPSVTPQEQAIKTLGEEMRITQKGITDEKVLLGFNMAIALCNKHIGEPQESEG